MEKENAGQSEEILDEALNACGVEPGISKGELREKMEKCVPEYINGKVTSPTE